MRPQHQHPVHEHRPRTGDEPMHARSPLRMRLALAFVGLANGLIGVGIFGFWLRSLPGTVIFAVVSVIALGNIAVVLHRIRQGAHFQPGPDIPPYHPAEEPGEPAEAPEPMSPTRRRVRYLIMMACCVLLLVMAWTWVRFYSVFAAGIMSLVAALIPPFAAMMANADSPILRQGEGRDRLEHPDPPPSETDPDRHRPPPD